MAHRGYSNEEVGETLTLLQTGLPQISIAWLTEIAQAFSRPASVDIDANDLISLFQDDTEFRFANVEVSHWEQLPKEIGILSKTPSLPLGPLSFMIQIFAGQSAPLGLFLDCRNALPAAECSVPRCVFGFYCDESLQDKARAHLLIGSRPRR